MQPIYRRILGAVFFVLWPTIALSIFHLTSFASSNKPLWDLAFTILSGIGSSVIASGIALLIAFLFKGEIRKTLQDILGYDKAPDELNVPVQMAVDLERNMSVFSRNMQRVIGQPITKALADQTYNLHRQAADMNTQLGIVFTLARQRVDAKNALTGTPEPTNKTEQALKILKGVE